VPRPFLLFGSRQSPVGYTTFGQNVWRGVQPLSLFVQTDLWLVGNSKLLCHPFLKNAGLGCKSHSWHQENKDITYSRSDYLHYCLMRMLVSAYSSLAITTLTLLSRIVSAQPILPQAQRPYDNQQEDLDQIPIEIGFGWHESKMGGVQPSGPPLLSDILGIDRSLSIFAGLSRSIESIVNSCV
jgi:hypothetical protein